MDFGRNDSLALEELSKVMYAALDAQLKVIYDHLHVKIETVDRPIIQTTVGKGYSLKAEVPIILPGADKLVVVGFAPGDGTGTNKDFPVMDALSKHRPRYKETKTGFFIPVGTLYNNDFIPQVTSLDELTINKHGRLAFLASHATHPHSYGYSLLDVIDYGSGTFKTKALTLTHHINGDNSFGDPHSTVFNIAIRDSSNLNYRDWIQLGAFVEFKEQTPEMKLLKLYADVCPTFDVEFTSDTPR